MDYFFIPNIYSAIRMRLTAIIFAIGLAWASCNSLVIADDDFANLAADSCLHCHDGTQDNGFDLTKLDRDFNDKPNFEDWVRVHDRIAAGEMPPATEPRPDPQLLNRTLQKLNEKLTEANVAEQKKNGRTVLRRLTRNELQHTLNDLLLTNLDLGEILPPENSSSEFDTVASEQGLSPLHVRAYIDAADAAIEEAIKIGPKPEQQNRVFNFLEQTAVQNHLEKKSPNQNEIVLLELEDSVVMFHTASYLFQLDDFYVHEKGVYRIKATAASYQSDRPVTLTLNVGHYHKGYKKMIGFFDLPPLKKKKDAPLPKDIEDRAGEFKTFTAEVVLQSGNYVFPGAMDVHVQPDAKTVWSVGAEAYTGSGVAIKNIEIEGPLSENWPPRSTTHLLQDVKLKKLDPPKWDPSRQAHVGFEIQTPENPRKELETITAWLAPRAFRRPLLHGEGTPFVDVGMAAIENGRSFDQAVRLTGKAILTAPDFLFMAPDPGPLDQFSIATRLSSFLWKSIPDERLFQLAKSKKLTDPKVLRTEVDRMLKHPKSKRFISDFCGQWLRLNDIDDTTPDKALYPEFDDLLKQSMIGETESFVNHLFQKNLSSSNLINSDFTFANRRLSEHYGIETTKAKQLRGQELRKISLPSDSPRGGLMTQAAILKVTANGTTTSPVRRGAWVLTHLLGQPPNPPPPNIGSVEPDTRGAQTIRELLAKHRDDASCNACHREIDPPGFAMECFDVIGGFRTSYRSQKNGKRPQQELNGRKIWEYSIGPPVDTTGRLATGEPFADISQFKRLLKNQNEQVARNLIENLIVYSTGAKIQFADRAEVERILEACREKDFGMKTMLHEVVTSKLFLNK